MLSRSGWGIKPEGGRVAYHEAQDSPLPDETGFFALQVLQHVIFKSTMITVKVEPGSKTPVPQAHAAGILPRSTWSAMKLAKVSRVVNWTSLQGLKPKRPVIVFSEAFTVPAKVAIPLTNP